MTEIKSQDLNLLVHPLVQLCTGMIKLSNNMKFFPFHLKVFQLFCMVQEKTGQFIPAAQYIMYPFDTASEYFNKRGKVMDDKTFPEFLVSLKVSKKHIETSEMKDKILREAIDELMIYFSLLSRNVTFPEYFVPIGVFLRKFKKHC